MGGWSNGKTLSLHQEIGVRLPGRSTDSDLLEGRQPDTVCRASVLTSALDGREGSIPCLPLIRFIPMVKRIIIPRF